MAPVTRALIVACVLAYVGQLAFDPALLRWLALWPLGTLFEPWQVLTYAFLHGSVGHLFFNMFGLYIFGSELERVWGARRYAILYGASVAAAALTQLLAAAYSGGQYPTVGASGGVFGLLLAFAVLFPRRRLVLLFPPIPMPAWLFVSLYAIAELMLGLSGAQSGVAHFAHLGGMLGGAIALLVFRAQRPAGNAD
jgi:membrane associated rhomboid family serine protease